MRTSSHIIFPPTGARQQRTNHKRQHQAGKTGEYGGYGYARGSSTAHFANRSVRFGVVLGTVALLINQSNTIPPPAKRTALCSLSIYKWAGQYRTERNETATPNH